MFLGARDGSAQAQFHSNSRSSGSKGKRIAAALVAGLVVATTLTGCAAGPTAPTRNIKKVTDGAEGDLGSLKVRDLLVVNQADGSGVLVGTVVNDGTASDTLTGITVAGIPVALGSAPVVLDQNMPVIFSGDSANNSAVVAGLNQSAGNRVPIELTFATAGSITLDAIVRDKSGDFANVGPVAAATPSPSASM
jgi:hypothetical protein